MTLGVDSATLAVARIPEIPQVGDDLFEVDLESITQRGEQPAPIKTKRYSWNPRNFAGQRSSVKIAMN